MIDYSQLFWLPSVTSELQDQDRVSFGKSIIVYIKITKGTPCSHFKDCIRVHISIKKFHQEIA